LFLGDEEAVFALIMCVISETLLERVFPSYLYIYFTHVFMYRPRQIRSPPDARRKGRRPGTREKGRTRPPPTPPNWSALRKPPPADPESR